MNSNWLGDLLWAGGEAARSHPLPMRIHQRRFIAVLRADGGGSTGPESHLSVINTNAVINFRRVRPVIPRNYDFFIGPPGLWRFITVPDQFAQRQAYVATRGMGKMWRPLKKLFDSVFSAVLVNTGVPVVSNCSQYILFTIKFHYCK